MSLSEDNQINFRIWRSYFSFFQGVKSANSDLFKVFHNAEKREENKSDSKFIWLSSLICKIKCACS